MIRIDLSDAGWDGLRLSANWDGLESKAGCYESRPNARDDVFLLRLKSNVL